MGGAPVFRCCSTPPSILQESRLSIARSKDTRHFCGAKSMFWSLVELESQSGRQQCEAQKPRELERRLRDQDPWQNPTRTHRVWQHVWIDGTVGAGIMAKRLRQTLAHSAGRVSMCDRVSAHPRCSG